MTASRGDERQLPDGVSGAAAVDLAILVQDDVGFQVSVVVVCGVVVGDDPRGDPQAAQDCGGGTGNGKKGQMSSATIVFSAAASGDRLTGVEDGGEDPALSVADGHPAAGVGQQDFCAAGPGGWRHPVGVVATPVAHQHAVVVSRIELNGGKF